MVCKILTWIGKRSNACELRNYKIKIVHDREGLNKFGVKIQSPKQMFVQRKLSETEIYR